MQLGGLGAL